MRRTRGIWIGVAAVGIMALAGYGGWRWQLAQNAMVTAAVETVPEVKSPEPEAAEVIAPAPEELAKAEKTPSEPKKKKEERRSMTEGARLGGVLEREGSCVSAEYWVAQGPQSTPPTAREWSEALSVYQEVKAQLAEFLRARSATVGVEKTAKLEKLLREVRLDRPPSAEEPDLAYRGIVIFTRDERGSPLLRMGPGFLKLAQSHTERARFELARAISQVWNPCDPELAGVWGKFSKCMGWDAVSQCESASYSDLAWSVSTWVAQQVAPPGCKVPGLNDAQFQVCSDRLPASTPSTKEAI